MHINIEIKAQCANPKHIKQILESHKADFKGIDHQIDTYFSVPNGRLKLREGIIENALIYYKRNNQTGPKQSDVTLYKSESPKQLKQLLESAFGVKVVVDKRRAIYFINNVKFHLDEVTGLGHFIEIEAIDLDGTIGKEQLQAQCEHYMQLLNIKQEDLVETSYSDLKGL